MKANRVIGLSLVLVVLMAVVAAAAVASSAPPAVVDDLVDEPVAQARDLAIQHMLDNYPADVGMPLIPDPEHWTAENLTPEGLMGSSTWQFTQGGWIATVQYAVVLEPIYTVTVEHETTSVPVFTVTVQNGEVSNFVSAQGVVPRTVVTNAPADVDDDAVDEAVTQARDLGMQCMLDNYPDGVGVPLVPHPDHWDAEYMTPDGWCGSSTWQFTQGGWTATVEYAVVLEPVYTVTVDYVTPSVPQFTATVQGGEVTGFEFA